MMMIHTGLNLRAGTCVVSLGLLAVGNAARRGSPTLRWKTLMTIKTLSVIALVTAALSSPVFAQDNNGEMTANQKPVHALRQHYRGAYNQVQGPAFVAPRAYEAAQPGFDRSRIGDYDPDYNPAGN
jgi:hypothetical protein